MQAYIIAVGKKSPPWVESAINEYLKRMPHEFRVQIISVPVTKRSKSKIIAQSQLVEENLLIKHTHKRSYRVALDESGGPCSTALLAEKINNCAQKFPAITFYIGGPDGFSQEFINNVDIVWSISSMTLPHMLVRVLLIEQLYRAWTLSKGHPYHRN